VEPEQREKRRCGGSGRHGGGCTRGPGPAPASRVLFVAEAVSCPAPVAAYRARAGGSLLVSVATVHGVLVFDMERLSPTRLVLSTHLLNASQIAIL
jgi:hypothetical protein